MSTLASKKRVVIAGGGFGGVAVARRLERLLRGRPDVEVVLVSRDNFQVVTPLLFEVFSGVLDLRSCSFPVRAALGTTRFIEAAIQGIDVDRRIVQFLCAGRRTELSYDQLVLAMGSKTNREMIPGSQHAFTFKTLADAMLLRNHVIERFERADQEMDPARKAQLLTFVVIGGGLVGVELVGEMTAFVDGIVCRYEHVDRGEVRIILFQAGDRLMPEIHPPLAAYGTGVLAKRRGVSLRSNTRVSAIEPGKVHLADEVVAADTVVLAAGITPNPVVARLAVEKDKGGRIVVGPTMRSSSHPEVWATGDCASIPGPDGKPYPTLAQHAVREARVLAENVAAVLDNRPPRPFIYNTRGMMGSLGHSKGFAQLLNLGVHGFPAWFMRRTYYLMQMPGWARRLRVIVDWTFALFLRPDIVKLNLDSETAILLREAALDAFEAEHEEGQIIDEHARV
jgi:NADH dehydrogenase